MMVGKIAVRTADGKDAGILWELNEEFNGKGCNTVSAMERSLEENRDEIVCVAEWEGQAAGFCCAQVVRSVCYAARYVEITELFVRETFRRRGIGKELLGFLEALCRKRYGIEEYRLLTGADNLPAQGLYRSMGYEREDEVFFVKTEG